MQTNEDREPDPGEYRCAMCTGIFALVRDETWSDEMALAEKARDFPDAALEECAVICDECYQRVRPDASSVDGVSALSGPHAFRPLRWWDRFLHKGLCWHCFSPRLAHPLRGWCMARPLGDKRRTNDCAGGFPP